MILIERKYPAQIVKTGIIKALQIRRSTLLNVKNNTEDKVTPFVSTYNPKHRELFEKSNMVILNNDITMTKIRNETKFIKSKRQLPNLKRLLTKSEFIENVVTPCVKKCKEPRCGLCSFIIFLSFISFSRTGEHGLYCPKCIICFSVQWVSGLLYRPNCWQIKK